MVAMDMYRPKWCSQSQDDVPKPITKWLPCPRSECGGDYIQLARSYMWNYSIDWVIIVQAMFSISCVAYNFATVSYIYINTFVANTGNVFHAILMCIYIVFTLLLDCLNSYCWCHICRSTSGYLKTTVHIHQQTPCNCLMWNRCLHIFVMKTYLCLLSKWT